MSAPTKTSDTAAQAAIGAAARELHLPTIRDEATRLAEIAVRERQTHLGFLAEESLLQFLAEKTGISFVSLADIGEISEENLSDYRKGWNQLLGGNFKDLVETGKRVR